MSRSPEPCSAIVVPLALASIVLLAGCGAEPKNVEISIEAPMSVQPGERFEIHAVVTNTGSRSQKLVALDVADEYLEGVAIESSDPPFKEAYHVPIDNTVSYVFKLPIEPGGQREVVFQAYAAHPGDHSGEIDFCINTDFTFVSHPLRTIVQ